MSRTPYPIGTENTPWNSQDKQLWLSKQLKKRSYEDDVITKINKLADKFNVEQFASLTYPQSDFPLFVIKTKSFSDTKPTVLVTGGVHGYETSGVHGALRFIETLPQHLADKFNIIVAPCISPWGYETINRWNPDAVDPNRSFYKNSPAQESRAIIEYIDSLNINLLAHIDLHETTDTDNSEFRPALAARDGKINTNWNIPDGFYLVSDSVKPEPDFQKAIIDSVKKVTHIAPSDENNQLIGVPQNQFGVISYAARELGLCMGFTDAKFVTTTEVYPDSPTASDEECIIAQVAAIHGALNYI